MLDKLSIFIMYGVIAILFEIEVMILIALLYFRKGFTIFEYLVIVVLSVILLLGAYITVNMILFPSIEIFHKLFGMGLIFILFCSGIFNMVYGLVCYFIYKLDFFLER